jgi:hypothetical protein
MYGNMKIWFKSRFFLLTLLLRDPWNDVVPDGVPEPGMDDSVPVIFMAGKRTPSFHRQGGIGNHRCCPIDNRRLFWGCH